MNHRLAIILLLSLLTLGCSPKIGPEIHHFKIKGEQWYTSKIYGYPDGKRTLVQIDTYKKQNQSRNSHMYNLKESILFYQKWPDNGYRFVSKTGFQTLKNGIYYFTNYSIVVPDNVIHKYYNKDFVEQIEVYKDGKRIKYNQGCPDGYKTMQFLRNKPGIYNWKDGKEYFEREFTEQEWERHKRTNEMLNRKKTTD